MNLSNDNPKADLVTMKQKEESLGAARERLAAYDAEILRLETELMGLKATRDKLAQSLEFIEEQISGKPIEVAHSVQPTRSKLNIREKIKIVLGEAGEDGLETIELKAAMEREWPTEPVNISSLRTNLSTMRGDEKSITRGKKKKWKLIKGETP